MIPGGVNSGQRQIPGLEDLVVVRTHGATFEDASGRVYTDYQSAFGPALLGHNDPDVDRAFAEQARRRRSHGRRRDAGRGGARREAGLGRAVAREGAADRQRIGRDVPRAPARPSRHGPAPRRSSSRAATTAGTTPSRLNLLSRARPDRTQGSDLGRHPPRGARRDPGRAVQRSRGRRDASSTSTRADVAAIIVEPIAHSMGAVLPRPGFLEGLRELCTRAGIVLVFDEVITGFRHAIGGYQSICGVTPDLSTFGKAMANGYPDRRHRRARRPDGRVQHQPRTPRDVRRHVQRAPRVRRRGARDDREARGRARARAHLRARRRASAASSPTSTRGSACRRSSRGTARSSSPTSCDGEPVVLRGPARQRPRALRRIPPRADRRGHLRAAARTSSAATSPTRTRQQHVDELIAGTEVAVRSVLARRR